MKLTSNALPGFLTASFSIAQSSSVFDSIENGKLSEVALFLNEGGNVNAQSSGGTLLMFAARYQQIDWPILPIGSSLI